MANSSTAVESTAKRYCPRLNHWKVHEDEKLSQLVQEHGPHDWNSIAEHIEGKTGKSCRSRWLNYLDPRVNRNPFTKEEEERLLAAHKLYGTRWSTIAKLFHGRTDNALKNHWQVLLTRQRRKSKKRSFQELINSSNTSFCSMKFGSIPSFSDSFPVLYSTTGKEGSDRFGLFYHADDGRMKRCLFDNSSSAFMELRASSTSEKEHTGYGGRKEVPFYDFLGVGVHNQ